MISIFDDINNAINDCIVNAKLYGVCHLVEDTGSLYPSTKRRNGVMVTPDDKYLVTVYHRLLNADLGDNDDLSFGRKKKIVTSQNVRTVMIFNLETETLPEDIANAIPDKLKLSGYDFVNISKEMNLNKDSNSIWEDEYGDSYKDKYVKRYNIYALEYKIDYLKCPICA